MQHAFRHCSFFCHGHDMNSSSTPSTLNTEATSVLSREWIHKGTKAYKHAGFALFLVGFIVYSHSYLHSAKAFRLVLRVALWHCH